MPTNVWQEVLDELQALVPPEDFRRWFAPTAYASDSGDQVTVWVPSEGAKRHLENHFHRTIKRALRLTGREGTVVRLVVAGDDDDDTEPT